MFIKLLTSFGSNEVVSVLDSGTEGPGFKSQPRSCRVTVFAPIVPLFTTLAARLSSNPKPGDVR